MFGHKKDKFEKILHQFKKSPSMVELTLEDLESLPDKIKNSPVNKIYSYGIKNTKILLVAVANKLDEMCPIKGDRLLLVEDFFAHSHNKAPDYCTMGGTFYFRVYVSKLHIYIYEMDNFARVQNLNIIQIDNIKSISSTKTHIILVEDSKDSNIGKSFLFVKKSQEQNKLYDLLLSLRINKKNIEGPNALERLLIKADKIG